MPNSHRKKKVHTQFYCCCQPDCWTNLKTNPFIDEIAGVGGDTSHDEDESMGSDGEYGADEYMHNADTLNKYNTYKSLIFVTFNVQSYPKTL